MSFSKAEAPPFGTWGFSCDVWTPEGGHVHLVALVEQRDGEEAFEKLLELVRIGEAAKDKEADDGPR